MKDNAYFPDPLLSRPEYMTELCIAAHFDDIGLLAYPAICDCYGRPDKYFTCMVLTNGADCDLGDLLMGLTGENSGNPQNGTICCRR